MTDSADESTEDTPDPTFDTEAETVTEAWEGVFLSTSWGYGQTNVELAQITEVSDTGKTVLARRVKAERTDHDRANESIRPTAEQYGDEFRLHVRTSRGDPRFRGSYPYIDGDMDTGTRRDSFRPFNNTEGNTVRQTAPNHGH
jgi:hypothetical protein